MRANVIIHLDQSQGIGIFRTSYTSEQIDAFPALMKINALTEESGDPMPANSMQTYEGVYFVECQTPGGSQSELDDPLHAEITNPSIGLYDPNNNRYNQTSDPDGHRFSYDFSFAIAEYEKTGIPQIVVKIAVGGTPLTNTPPITKVSWNPYITGVSSLREFVQRHIPRALTTIANAGYTNLTGVMLWGQGEGDQEAVVATYKAYFYDLHELVRAACGVTVLPVCFRIPTIGTLGGNAATAQREMIAETPEFCGFDANSLASTSAFNYPYPVSPFDAIHWLHKALWNAGFQMSRIYDGYRYRFDNRL